MKPATKHSSSSDRCFLPCRRWILSGIMFFFSFLFSLGVESGNFAAKDEGLYGSVGFVISRGRDLRGGMTSAV